MKEIKDKIFTTDISKEQAKDTGMAMTLLLLLVGTFTGNIALYKLAIPVIVLAMIVPKIYFPIAVLWLGLSHLLGTIVSKIILSIVFLVIVTPIGLFRRLIGKDTLKLKGYKKDKTSVFKQRNHTFAAEDLEKPF